MKFTELELKAHFAKITGHAVVQVFIAYDNEEEIKIFRQRGELIRKRYHFHQKYLYLLSLPSEEKVEHSKLQYLLDKKSKMTQSIKDIDRGMKAKKEKQIPICAFVTFDMEFGAHVALRLYNRSVLGYLWMPEHLKFKGSKLIVAAAPEPSTIIWENLAVRMLQTVACNAAI